MTEGREESPQLNPTQIQGTITEDKPVALRTRRCRQQTVPISTNDCKGDLFQATHQESNNDNELVRQLKTKIKEQENSISELSSAVERFLKVQPIVKKLQVDFLNISKHVVPEDKFKVTDPKIDDSEIVKPFTPSLEKWTKQRAMKEIQHSAEYCLRFLTDSSGFYPGDPAYEKLCKKWWKDHNKEMEKLKRLPDNVESGTSDEISQCQDTSADTTKHTVTSEKNSCKLLACMATPKK